MKKLFLSALLATTALALAGDKGNGGGGHVCDGQRAVQMYDLYEGYARYNLTIPDRGLTVDQYLREALDKVENASPYVGYRIRTTLTKALEENRFLLRSNIRLTPSEDVNILVVNQGCRYEQMANWDIVSNNILINEELWNRMGNLGRAALYFHEATYAVDRAITRTTTSDATRKFVAEVFSPTNSLAGNSFLSRLRPREGHNEVRDAVVLAQPAPRSVALRAEGSNVRLDVHSGDASAWDPAYKVRYTIRYPKYEAFLARAKPLDEEFMRIVGSRYPQRNRAREAAGRSFLQAHPEVIQYFALTRDILGLIPQAERSQFLGRQNVNVPVIYFSPEVTMYPVGNTRTPSFEAGFQDYQLTVELLENDVIVESASLEMTRSSADVPSRLLVNYTQNGR
jgi:hypothetical protein